MMGKHYDYLKQDHQERVERERQFQEALKITKERKGDAIQREGIYFVGVYNLVKQCIEQVKADLGITFKTGDKIEHCARHWTFPEDYYVLDETYQTQAFSGPLFRHWAWGQEVRLDHPKHSGRYVSLKLAIGLGLFSTTMDPWDPKDRRTDPWDDDLFTYMGLQIYVYHDQMVDEQRRKIAPQAHWVVLPTEAKSMKPSDLLEMLAASFVVITTLVEDLPNYETFWCEQNFDNAPSSQALEDAVGDAIDKIFPDHEMPLLSFSLSDAERIVPVQPVVITT
jgi:hypothetical protein